MTNRMEWQPIETARFTLVFKGDIRDFKGNPFHADTPFGRPVASCIGSALDECAAAEDRISELESEVERLKEDVSRQMEIANSECARAEKAEEAQQVLHATLMRVETEKVNAQLALSDEVYRRQMAECELAGERAAYLFIASKSRKEVVADAIRARSTAMNKGGE